MITFAKSCFVCCDKKVILLKITTNYVQDLLFFSIFLFEWKNAYNNKLIFIDLNLVIKMSTTMLWIFECVSSKSNILFDDEIFKNWLLFQQVSYFLDMSIYINMNCTILFSSFIVISPSLFRPHFHFRCRTFSDLIFSFLVCELAQFVASCCRRFLQIFQ